VDGFEKESVEERGEGGEEDLGRLRRVQVQIGGGGVAYTK